MLHHIETIFVMVIVYNMTKNHNVKIKMILCTILCQCGSLASPGYCLVHHHAKTAVIMIEISILACHRIFIMKLKVCELFKWKNLCYVHSFSFSCWCMPALWDMGHFFGRLLVIYCAKTAIKITISFITYQRLLIIMLKTCRLFSFTKFLCVHLFGCCLVTCCANYIFVMIATSIMTYNHNVKIKHLSATL